MSCTYRKIFVAKYPTIKAQWTVQNKNPDTICDNFGAL